MAFAAAGDLVVGVDVALPERMGQGPGGESTQTGSITWVQADVAEESQVALALRAVGPALHVLVNNAGLSWFGPLETEPIERFDRVLAVGLRGPYLLSRLAAPQLRVAGGAAIINITSTSAFQSEPGSEAYAAAKGGWGARWTSLKPASSSPIRLGPAS